MRRIRASASAVALEIGMSREAVNNWRRGYSKPSKKHRDKVVACSNYLRLSEAECNELLASVGFDHEYALYQSTNQSQDHLFIQLEQAQPYPILMVLTQDHLDQPPQKQLIVEAAQTKYPDRQTLHVQLPYSNNITVADFFHFIGQQMGLMQVHDELSFEFALNDLLQATEINLIITRFEQGNQTCRNLLSGVLRNLCEMHVGRIHLVLCGGEQLSALKYAQGDLSLLNIASAYMMTFDLAQWLAVQTIINHSFDHHQVMYELIGNHPSMASSLFAAIQEGHDHEALIQMVMNSDVLFSDFNQVIRQSGKAPLQEKLTADGLGPYRPYIQDPVLRQLFWLNLIGKNQDNQLVWHSDTIRQVGINLLAEQSL